MPEFDVDDYVIYPEHGAGQIVEATEETVEGETREYFVFHALVDDIVVKFPQQGGPNIRPPHSKSTIKEQLRNMRSFLEEQAEAEDLYKIKRSHLEELGEVIRQEADFEATVEALMKLRPRYEARDMNIGEKQTYDLAQRFCLGEMMAVYGYDEEKARQELLEYMPSQKT